MSPAKLATGTQAFVLALVLLVAMVVLLVLHDIDSAVAVPIIVGIASGGGGAVAGKAANGS